MVEVISHEQANQQLKQITNIAPNKDAVNKKGQNQNRDDKRGNKEQEVFSEEWSQKSSDARKRDQLQSEVNGNNEQSNKKAKKNKKRKNKNKKNG